MDTKLLQILVCPVTKGPLIYDKKANELISNSARLAYPIRDGIPVMLEDEARKTTLMSQSCLSGSSFLASSSSMTGMPSRMGYAKRADFEISSLAFLS